MEGNKMQMFDGSTQTEANQDVTMDSYRMKINTTKTKLLTAGFSLNEFASTEKSLKRSKVSNNWALITATGQGEKNIDNRINNAHVAFCCLCT